MPAPNKFEWMKKVYAFVAFLFLINTASTQDYNIGIRAGLNFSQFLGPSENDVIEDFNIASGFHFGINFQWNFNSFLGVRSEILYHQIGSKYKFDGVGYYVFRLRTFSRFVVRDRSEIELDHSNAYLSFPFTAHLTLSEKFEIYGGGYLGLLVSPVASGTWRFGVEGDQFVNDYSFEQGLDFNYNSDRAFQSNPFGRPILIIVNDQNVDLPGIAGAYYLYGETIETKKFKGFDYGLVGGFSYFLNRGLFISARLEYGLTDITNAVVDHSYKSVEDDGTLIFNDDYDRNLNVAISFGFRF